MEFKKNNLMILILFQILFISIIKSSPQCKLKLSCDEYCSEVKLENGLNHNLALKNLDSISSLDYSQYEELIFDCQPGDKIFFSSTNTNNEKNGGIVCFLDIVDETETISFKSSLNPEKFENNGNCAINIDKLLNINDSEEKILEFSGARTVIFKFEIPYDFIIENNNHIYDNVLYNIGKIFTFEYFLKPSLPNAETNHRLQVKIIELPDPSNAKLKIEGNNNEIHLDDILEINENIKFEPIDNIEKYGLFSVKFKVSVMSNIVNEERIIKFNVCYKYCLTCGTYNDGLANDYKCLTCTTNNYLVDPNNPINNLGRCYTPEEKQLLFPNFYLDSNIYKECDESCSICSESEDHCEICKNNYFKVDGQGEYTCYELDYIDSNFQNYYFDKNSALYKMCNNNCQTCILNSNNCLTCDYITYFFLKIKKKINAFYVLKFLILIIIVKEQVLIY